MRASDIHEIMDIEHRSHPTPWPAEAFIGELDREWAFVDVMRVYQDRDASSVVAFCNYWLVHDEVHLLNLATHPNWRRRGIGTMLMQHLLGFARDHGCRYVTLEVRITNHAAQALYQAHGFEVVGARPGYYPDTGEDALIMTLELDANSPG